MNEKGFTLVEILVALVAGGLLLGSISWVIAGLSDDLKATEKWDQDLQISTTASLLDDILTDARFSDASSRPLSRSRRKLAFQMQAPLSIGRQGYVEAQLVVEHDAKGENLKLLLPGQELPEAILLSDMKDIKLHYEVNANDDGSPAFLKKIEIAISDQSGSEPQTLSIRPRVNAVGACIFDLISQRCRT